MKSYGPGFRYRMPHHSSGHTCAYPHTPDAYPVFLGEQRSRKAPCASAGSSAYHAVADNPLMFAYYAPRCLHAVVRAGQANLRQSCIDRCIA